MNRSHYRTARPLWEEIAGWGLAVFIGSVTAYFLITGLST